MRSSPASSAATCCVKRWPCAESKITDCFARPATRSIPRSQLQRLQTFKERFRLQHHAFAAAERAVIHGAVLVVRKLPQVVDFDFRQAHLAGPAGNSVIQWSLKEAGKNRQDIGFHLDLQNL